MSSELSVSAEADISESIQSKQTDSYKHLLVDKPLVQDTSTRSIFMPKLEVDTDLHLTRQDVEQSIRALIKNTEVSKVKKVEMSPMYPMPGILAQFAEKTYTTRGEKYDRDFEKQLKLPVGWKMLTVASNNSLNNGYYGIAFWHPENHQVVVAHRGTEPTSFGALYTDLKGIVFNTYAAQMNSASTFAEIISTVLRKLNKELDVNFQLFFTGHSLGGWLAQVTTFTTKYLKKEDAHFGKCLDPLDEYHSHAVVFDSPGCKETLVQMQSDFGMYCSHDHTISLESLDVTSYLSAPNRINTCNTHVGTIYRVFTNLSNMSNLEKVTPLYNIVTHSIDNILEVFDVDSGAILQDEFGNVRAQRVMDWPISSGLDGGEEYILFFKSAKGSNNFHPDENDEENNEHVNKFPLQYETRDYDDTMCSVSIFTQSEIQFLERYLMVRDLTDLFVLDELFSSFKNKNVSDHVCNTLKTYRIEVGHISCLSNHELQSLISLVKNILRFFPDVESKMREVLTLFAVSETILQSESTSYRDTLSDVLSLNVDQVLDMEEMNTFLNSEVQIWCVAFEEENNALISFGAVYKAFKMTGEEHYQKTHFMFSFDQIMNLNKHIDLANFLDSDQITDFLLLVNCQPSSNTISEQAVSNIFEKLLKPLKNKPGIKVILNVQKGNILFSSLIKNAIENMDFKCIETQVKMLVWNDLSVDLQETLLKKELVTFQGRTDKISLVELLEIGDINKINSTELGNIIDSHTLLKLINNEEVVVSNALPTFSGHYYIERSFYRSKVLLKDDLFKDESITDIFALSNVEEEDIVNLVSGENVIKFEEISYDDVKFKFVVLSNENAEEDFRQMCKHLKKHTLHWLSKESSGIYVWQKSKGSIAGLLKHKEQSEDEAVSRECGRRVYDESALLFERDSKIVLVSGVPRLGKSAVLTHISMKVKETAPSRWVIKIGLNEGFRNVDADNLDFDNLAMDQAIDVLWNMYVPNYNALDRKIFQQCFRLPQRIAILFDSLAEVSLPYRENAVKLIKVLRNSKAVEQIWVTTNENDKYCLEKELEVFAYSLMPFSDGDLINFFNDFWKCKLNLDEVDKGRLDIFTDTLVELLPNAVHETSQDITKVMLHIKMLAELVMNEFKNSSSFETVHDAPDTLNLGELYKTFVGQKFMSYFNKMTFDTGNADKSQLQKVARETLYQSFVENQEYSALYTLFEESPLYKLVGESKLLTLFSSPKGTNDTGSTIDKHTANDNNDS